MKVKSKKRWKKFLSNFTLLILSIVVSLIVLEFLVRIFYPQKLYFNITQWDEYVGFKFIPNSENYTEHIDYKMHVKINSHGLRDREIDYYKPANTIRIGVFGDSFTYGEGVQNDETYPKQLEKLFSENLEIKNSGKQVEVLNFGIGKSGTSHQLAIYQSEGIKYELDYIIIGFYGSNDFRDNLTGVFYLRDNELIHNPTAYSSIRKIQNTVNRIPGYIWASSNSHLVNLLKTTATIYDDKKRRKNVKTVNVQDQAIKDEALNKKKIEITCRLFEEFKIETENNNDSLMVLNFPKKEHKLLIDPMNETGIPSYIDLTDSVINRLQKNNVRVIDLVPVFMELPTEDYYFEHDGHMNPHGHELIAREVYQSLLPEILFFVNK